MCIEDFSNLSDEELRDFLASGECEYLDPGTRNDLYDRLPPEYQAEVTEWDYKFTDMAIGDDSWRDDD